MVGIVMCGVRRCQAYDCSFLQLPRFTQVGYAGRLTVLQKNMTAEITPAYAANGPQMMYFASPGINGGVPIGTSGAAVNDMCPYGTGTYNNVNRLVSQPLIT